MTDKIVKWADRAQFHAETFEDLDGVLETMGVTPKVSLIWMTPDPLGALASFNAMYEGRVVRSMDDVTDEQRRKALIDVQATHLQAPLENIKVQFLIEGVDRSFTHQLVRQRTAVFAQESMRFAVPGELQDATTLPPSLQGTQRTDDNVDYQYESDAQKQRVVWDGVINHIDKAYHQLVNSGMPAEEARGLLPHCVATRVQFTTDFRNLIAHSGNRLCTQAQFHWRSVFTQMVEEIRTQLPAEDQWQGMLIADSNMFKPVCMQLGRCPFNASFDRACSIRDRVEAFSRAGVPSSEWADPKHDLRSGSGSGSIQDEDWRLDVAAARVAP